MSAAEILAAIAFAVIATLVTAWLIVGADQKACERKWKDSGLQARHDMHAGCRVKVNGVWMPEAAVRISSEVSK